MVIRRLKKILLSKLKKHFLLHNATFLILFYFLSQPKLFQIKKKLKKTKFIKNFTSPKINKIQIFQIFPK